MAIEQADRLSREVAKAKAPPSKQSSNLDDDFTAWLAKRAASKTHVQDASLVVDSEGEKKFILTTVSFTDLEFRNHDYNPRTPSQGKVFELMASVRTLGLLNPLVCAYLEPDQRSKESPEPVVLIDGRHRYQALSELRKQSPSWRQKGRVDLKIYYELQKSDLYLLATYLNRSRRALKKGEYYTAIVDIYDARKSELEQQYKGQAQTETAIFKSIQSRQLNDADFDLSVGRIVGLTAFNREEAKSWFPMVANNQNQRFGDEEKRFQGYVPLTAGNLAEFLRPLCKVGPYDDPGDKRAVEISNVLKLGQEFRENGILDPYKDHKKATATSVACKFWPLVSFGKLLSVSSLFPRPSGAARAPLADTELDWKLIRSTVDAYHSIMEAQAKLVNQYKAEKNKTDLPEEVLQRCWSYQTQRDQVIVPLRKALKEQLKSAVTFSEQVD